MAFFGVKLFFFIIFGGLLAFYVNYNPAIEVSEDLLNWEATSAKWFFFKHQKTTHKIFYKDEKGSRPEGPTLVLLHGFPSASYDWIKVWPALLEKFGRVIAPDFLGFGFSEKPLEHEYSIMQQADIIEQILQQNSIRNFHILAHDYGDTVAQELLSRYEERQASGNFNPQLIHSVALLNGGIFPETNFPRIVQQGLLVPYLGAILVRLSNFYTFKRGFGEVFGPGTQPTEQEFQDFWSLIRKRDGNLVLNKLIQYIPERQENKDRWTSVLQTTEVPVHVIYGPADPVNPPGFVSFYKKTVPNPRIDVLDGHIGHYPQWEDAAECMTSYFSFIKTLPYRPVVPKVAAPATGAAQGKPGEEKPKVPVQVSKTPAAEEKKAPKVVDVKTPAAEEKKAPKVVDVKTKPVEKSDQAPEAKVVKPVATGDVPKPDPKKVPQPAQKDKLPQQPQGKPAEAAKKVADKLPTQTEKAKEAVAQAKKPDVKKVDEKVNVKPKVKTDADIKSKVEKKNVPTQAKQDVKPKETQTGNDKPKPNNIKDKKVKPATNPSKPKPTPKP